MKAFIFGLIFLTMISTLTIGQPDTTVHSPKPALPVICPITFRLYFNLLGDNFKELTLAPFKIRKNQLVNLGIFTGVTVGLLFVDPSVDSYARRLERQQPDVMPVSNVVTSFGSNYGIYTVGAIGICAYLFNDKKLQVVTWLVTQSMITFFGLYASW